ncbi:MAG TPA: LacI family DNA-binding transcriptional regulator [Microlunatus sp.]|jgi:DNA-binding LacI/PurR family transcriptional regulator|nr:LacI family DNA-binding transcriptional regulator [Microlunatus sp.]
MQRAATIHDVAAAAGVSRQTVTRAMNDMPGINGDTRARVLAAAASLRYRPSRFGRGLVKADHRMLGLVLDDLTNPFYPQLASAVTGAAGRAGWNVVLTDTTHAGDRATLLTELSRQVDVVIGYLRLDPEAQARLFAGVPVVEIDANRRQPLNGAVAFDLRPAMRDLVRHLVAQAVRRPLMVDQASPGQRSGRAKIFASELDRRGLGCDHVTIATGSTEGDLAAIGAALDAHPDADAVLVYNDLLALGVIGALRDRGRRVPGDVRVVGIDGLSIGELVAPRLTTLALDMAEVGRLATDLVLGMRAGELPLSGSEVRRKVRHRLLLRDSA